MNIIFVFKRFYTGKDVINHQFGRLYEFPSQLARLGHHVTIICFDYRNGSSVDGFTESFGAGFVEWITVSFSDFWKFNISKIYQRLKTSGANLVVGSSDIPSLWVARRLAIKLAVPYVVDLYDNYESFGQARIPGFLEVLYRCVRAADLVVTVGRDLKEKVHLSYKPACPVIVINNGVGQTSFFRGDRKEARKKLGLPLDQKLIGTAGTLSRMKGVDTVYDAWKEIEFATEDVCLVLAGREGANFPVPQGDRVFYLGELLEEQVGELFRALDVGIVPAHNSGFGRYCFPQKLYEMVSCGLPIVGARVGSIAQLLRNQPETLFEPGSVAELTAVLRKQLRDCVAADVKPKTWVELVRGLESHLLRLI
ncbi:glycosyltransferase family 4 protein [Aestuariicella sp. G3-2]|uniref:glycosyltransferase family 4 protein n=1 Tax=Pseudomaricurvus albidus TaxID=2842452 RepID=UPI001C0BFD9E|nr:glycosyltransferase family 4 protein [Aestuariicella albida]